MGLGKPWTVSLLLLSSVALIPGCRQNGTTRLAQDFHSYQTVEEVRAELKNKGFNAGWQENSQATAPGDKRPSYEIRDLAGAYKSLGVDGHLRLTFYNGYLMEAQFSPERTNDYLSALQKAGAGVPTKPSEEISIDRRTRFRFDVGESGRSLFTWYDSKLENEWRRWVANNS